MKAGGWTRHVLVPFAVTRAGLLVAGVFGLGLIGSVRANFSNLVAHTPAPLPLEIWARWDSEWYLLIAEHGYRVDSFLSGYSLNYRSEDATGFFPLYPVLIRLLGGCGLPPVAAGVLISNAALLVALTLLRVLVREETDGESTGASSWFLLTFPASLFFSAVYSESLALALTLAAFLAARRGRWAWLAASGFFCALTRPTGILTAIALGWEVRKRQGGWKGWLSLCGFPAGTAVFSLFCYATFGDSLTWLRRQARWRGVSSGPWRAFERFFENPPRLHGSHDSVLELIVAILFILALVPILRNFPPSWGVYSLLGVLVPLGSTLWSFSRLALTIFPFFVLLAQEAKRRPVVLPAYLSFALPLGGVLMLLFACGWWAG